MKKDELLLIYIYIYVYIISLIMALWVIAEDVHNHSGESCISFFLSIKISALQFLERRSNMNMAHSSRERKTIDEDMSFSSTRAT